MPEMPYDATPQDATTVTGWLVDWRKGSREAGGRLFAASYQELRRLAAWHFPERAAWAHFAAYSLGP